MPNLFFIDLDDFCEENTDKDLIRSLKEAVPNLKLNLFTIPGKCSLSFIDNIRIYSWVNLIPHGHIHSTSRECQNWTYETASYHLQSLEKEGWIHGWKSPGWQTSDDLYRALADRGWWVAAQEYDRERIPPELKVYYLDSPYKIHGHIGHWGAKNSNSLEFIFESIASLKGDFEFIDDIMYEH